MLQTSQLFVESTIKCLCKLSDCRKVGYSVLWDENVGSFRTVCNSTVGYSVVGW